MRTRPVVIVFSALAALQFFISGSAVAEIVDPKVLGVIGLAVASAQLFMTKVVENQTVPFGASLAYVNKDGVPVAGPASPATIRDGEVVTGLVVEPESGPAEDDLDPDSVEVHDTL